MHKRTLWRVSVALVLLAVAWVPAVAAKGPDGSLPCPVPAAGSAAPVNVEVGTYLISFGSYDTAKGTYVMDLYLHFRYDAHAADGNFTVSKFEFMNGRAGSRDLLSDDTAADGMRDVWYRVQANLYSEPDFTRYPFDRQQLKLVLEDSVHTDADLVYVPMAEGGAAYDPDVHVAGWNIDAFTATTSTKAYPFGESYCRLSYTLAISREPLSSGMRAFLPPFAFMLVASFSFFFDRAQAANRLALGTGMLITAVGFHISQTVGLPALGALSLFDQVMIAVYTFIAATILVTTVLAFGERLRLPERASKLINQRGALLAVAAPVLVFLLLHFV